MDSSDMLQFITEQDAMADPDHTATEALAAEKHMKYPPYHRAKYDRIKERVLAKRKLNYVPTGRPVGRPRLPRE
jgi:hypothetical protein